MIRFAPIWTVARDELRLTRRTFRYWVFTAGSFLLGLVAWVYYSALHGFLSGYSGTVALIGPHYLFTAVGFYFLTVFMFGVAFLGFDVRARDQREGIVEVLDARPLSNLELIAGRWLGLVLAAWLPVVGLTLFATLLGWLLTALDAPLGDVPTLHSLLAFVGFMAIPALAFGFALVFVITLLVRHRLLAAVLSLAALYGLFAALVIAGPGTAALVDYIGIAQLGATSDFVPAIARDLWAWLQRVGVLLVAFGLIGIAAAIHPRLDDGRRAIRFAAGTAVVIAGLGLLGGAGGARQRAIPQLDQWAAAHQAHADDVVPDLVAIRGEVVIEPGRVLDGKLALEFRARPGTSLTRALFTLNPGLTVQRITNADGNPIEFTHANGLLELVLPQPLAGGEVMTVALDYRGAPRLAFGYLDSAVVIERGNIIASTVGLLGTDRGIFDRRYVALLPGIGWLPVPGADVARDDPRLRPRDFFLLDLEVEVPEGWLPAGPGRREDRTGAAPDRARYRFAPGVPVPEVALLAGRFAQRQTEIEGVTIELLTHPAHRRALGALEPHGERIRAFAADKLRLARAEGLAYPFTALTLVETPFNLRVFRGGWQLGLGIGPPGLILLRECGFPTARFDTLYRNEDDPPDAAMVLNRFFSNDFSAGNALAALAQSFFAHQTGATGAEALALDFTLDELATLTLTETRSYFSAHLFDGGFNTRVGQVVQQYQDRRPRTLTLGDVVVQTFASRPEVWERVLSSSLLELAPRQNPRQTLDILSLKAGALAKLLYDQLGAAGSSRLLGSLAELHRGGNFTVEDFVTALADAGIAEPQTLVADWLTTTRLPGFVAAPVEFYRIADDALGTPRFQLKVRVRNDEPVPGTIRVTSVESTRDDDQIDTNQMRLMPSELIRVPGESAIEYAVVLTRKPISVWIEPSLSLNRGSFVAFSDYESTSVATVGRRDDPPQLGVSTIDWTPPDEGIVVDDLDPGFAIVRDAAATGTRLGGVLATNSGDIDQGLPRVPERQVPNNWSRADAPNGWGKYRHTVALQRPGDGATRATFTTTLPRAGRWRLELHLPNLVFTSGIAAWGRWTLHLTAGDTKHQVAFDTAGGVAGWNEIGEYELPPGEVTLALSDSTEGRLIVADAIRWLPRDNGREQ
ncbi:MAG: hypothetical protein IT494_00345 [Gammaproteobacteria bacterium]|nr:hypothetical protein [Gammaproteobacteria bacterium]